MSLVIDAPAPTVLSVLGGRQFPVRRIYCVGRNYADHAREMGSDPSREAPFFFSKPTDAATNNSEIAYPPQTANLHFEVELVLALKSGGRDITVDNALSHVYGSAVGVDLTRRDLQAAAKDKGRPWDMAKGFDQSAPIGLLTPGVSPQTGTMSLSVNGETKQSTDINQIIWSNAEIIAHLSTHVDLKAGDLIFTGTPAGVGPLSVGDHVRAEITGLSPLIFKLISR
ncbi:fumarylacetoacetate hydrolase family protein [Woodsholea maritima]|uniref:fumarylacetoacetate hydrolase family protein n=1 Tax=Woodsholea maritima TaxID=240237 RepID=UPI00038103D7|nr:fumarylacetoacetate hydrolase family protein [Woodsholea maritima]